MGNPEERREEERPGRERIGGGGTFRGAGGVFRILDIPHTRGRTVLLHTAAWLLFGVFVGAVVQQLGFVVGKTGGSPVLVALVTTGPYAASALALLYVPWFERHHARSLVAVPRILGAGVLVFSVFCGSAVSLGAVAFVAVAIYMVGNVFYGRLLGELYPVQSRGRLLSLPMFVQAAAMAGISVAAGKALGSSEGAYRWFLPIGSVIGVLAGIVVLRFPASETSPAPVRTRLRESVREVARDRPFLLWMLVYSATSIGYWLSYAARPVYFDKMLGFGYWENGIAIAVFNGAYCAGFLVCGRLLDRIRSLLTMVASWALMGAGILVMVYGGGFTWVLVGQALSGLGLAGNDMAWFPVVLEFAPKGSVDRYMGFYMTVFGVRVLVGGAVSGTLMQLGPRGSQHALLLASATMLAGSAGIFLLRRRLRPSGR